MADASAWAPSLVGRDRELAVLREAMDAVALGQGQVVLVEGEPGIGKTRLAATVCDRARGTGFEVGVGVCDDLAASRPFAPVIEALGISSNSPDPERAAIAALVDASLAPNATVLGGPGTGMHYRVTEALAAVVERAAERSPLVLVLDDLQWADVSTLVAVRFIARRVPTLPVLLVLSARAGHDSAELHRVADDLLRSAATRLHLKPLDDASVTALIEEVLDGTPSETLLDRARGASGNPLFVIEYVRSLQAAPTADAAESSAALEFRLTVLRRLASLPGSVGDVLRLAAVLGATFSPADLAVVAGRSIVELAPVLQQAVASAMLEERGAQLAFRHMLVRDAIYEHVPFGVRGQLHREAGRALAQAGADALTVAHHLSLGASTEDPEAADWLRQAARSVAPRSPATAVELLGRARDLLAPNSPARSAVLAELAVALAWSGQLADATELGLEVLRRRPDPSVAGPLRCGLVYALTWQGRPGEALRHATLDPGEGLGEWDEALLRALAAVASLFAFDFPSAALYATEAAASAERLGHDVALCHALTAQTWVAMFAGRAHEALELGLRAVELADRVGGEAHLAHPRFYIAQPLMGVDRIDEAEEVLRSGLRLAEGLGLAWSFPLYHSRLGAIGFLNGDWDGAIAEIEAGQAVAEEVGLHVGSVEVSSAWLAAIQLHRDELEAAERTLTTAMRRLADTGPQLGVAVLNWAQALVLEARNRPDEAIDLLERAVAMYRPGGPVTDPWSLMAFVRLCVSSGDHRRAAIGVPAIEAQADSGNPLLMGQALRARGLLERDADLLVEAVALSRGGRNPLQAAETCEDAAAVLAAVGRVGEAVPMWDEAAALYEGLGAHRDVARVAAEARRHGVTRGTRRRHTRASAGWESLTGTELKVIALVAQRLSNPEVAERLFISRHTVESHLKHIYRKLELSSRQELAAEYVKRSERERG